ncbi:MAG: glycosyltransferase family 4 protein [Bacteroidota bacterium]
MLNVGHHYFVGGGSDRYMLALGALLKSRGHAVVPFATAHERNEPTPWADYFPAGVNPSEPRLTDALRFLWSTEARTAMQRVLAEAQSDLAHLHIYYGQLTASILGPLHEARVPVVQSLHEYKLACPVYSFVSNGAVCEACAGQSFWRALPRRCNRGSVMRTAASIAEAYLSRWAGDVRRVDHFIAVSDFMRRKMEEYGLGAGRITTVHNFVDAKAVEPATDTGSYAFYFGRLERLKGLFTLIEAAGAVPALPLWIAGEGKARSELEAEVQRQGWSHIRFLGFQRGQALEDLIRGARCTVLPAEWYENCPMSILEALAYARPVVGSRIGGIPELIEDGVDGYLFEPGNIEELRAILRGFSSEPEQTVEMGRAGRAKVKQRFSPDAHYAQIRAVYDQVLHT